MQAAESGEDVTIYACGGDGTICEAAQALYNAPNITLAPVPVGTGNDFVRTITGNGKSFSISELIFDGKPLTSI